MSESGSGNRAAFVLAMFDGGRIPSFFVMMALDFSVTEPGGSHSIAKVNVLGNPAEISLPGDRRQ
jgi:hypothetical protein